MATTDQLRKAERVFGLTLNAYSRDRYIRELELIGQKGVRSLSKVELWKRVRTAGIIIVPDWRKEELTTAERERCAKIADTFA